MPPSPAMREDKHKRGCSFENGILFHENDEGLALFNEVQDKERDDFLLKTNDVFDDDVFSTKLRYFDDYKLGVSIPARGESSDLLNGDGDKNDYDWLITPPETPLFRSLDDEPVTLAPSRGRARSQPISISRSSTMEKGHWSARGSASPHRLSPSPRSGNSPPQLRSRPLSVTSSPPPTLRHLSPSRMQSPPPSKLTPSPMSSKSTPRRMSTGSAAAINPSRVRGISPVKSSRGNSASPKIKAWQSNIPGFSLEVPPNLRTSLDDRPASYVRGSSPASRNSSRSGRQSMSPIASRSISSCHSHERELFSSYNRGSVGSSFDDDLDSLQSIPVSSSGCSVPRSTGSLLNNRAMGYSKKPTKLLSSSAPKRSLDSTFRQMDRKGPQDMFRPLLSSVPSSSFYVGKASTHHRTLISRNSSMTTSSNASSDLGTSGVLDAEENEQTPKNVTSESVKCQYSNPTVGDEVFVMDQADSINVSLQCRIIEDSIGCRHLENNRPAAVTSQLGITECSNKPVTATSTATAVDSADVISNTKYDTLDVDGCSKVELCSKCSREFHLSELLMEGDLWICQECKSSEKNSNESETLINHLDHTADGDHVSNNEPTEDLAVSLIEEGELNVPIDQLIDLSMGGDGDYPNSKVDVSEGTGISLVLKRSSSSKAHIVQSRSFTASNISYDDFSYVRDSSNSMRTSIGHSSVSVSSSVDLGSSRQTETRIHQQSSNRRSDAENYRYETSSKHKRSISSLSGASGHAFQASNGVPSCLEDTPNVVAVHKDKEVRSMVCADPRDLSLASESTETESTCTNAEPLNRLKDDNTGAVSTLTAGDSVLHDNDNDSTNNCRHLANEETSTANLQCSIHGEEVSVTNSFDATSEIDVENADTLLADLQSNVGSLNSKNCAAELLERSVLVPQGDVTSASVDELDVSNPAHGTVDESTTVLEGLGGTKLRSLTFDEATDSILFCSSIVHCLAYEAANIAIDKDSPPLEVLRPVTFIGKPNSDKRETQLMTIGKRGSKSKKARERRPEVDAKPPSVIMEEPEVKSSPRIVRSPTAADNMNPPKLESKCNCVIM